ILVMVSADRAWQGRLRFDRPRHRINMGMPVDYPRINQFPELFTVEPGGRYRVRDLQTGKARVYGGAELVEGLSIRVSGGEELFWEVLPL
ncbi:MAG: hypothetical protein RL151_1546, partial [Bacteroidota bacterium]